MPIGRKPQVAANPILQRVREVIEESGESQNALARAKVGTQAMISDWFKKDDLEPGSGALARLVVELGLNGHWLLTGQGDRHVLPAEGADRVYADGVQAGFRRAVQLLQEAATSVGGAEAEMSTLEMLAVDQAEAREGSRPLPGTASPESLPPAAEG